MACKIERSQYLPLLTLRIAQEQGVQNETRNNDGLETEYQGRSGSNLSHHAAMSNAELQEKFAGMY